MNIRTIDLGTIPFRRLQAEYMRRHYRNMRDTEKLYREPLCDYCGEPSGRLYDVEIRDDAVGYVEQAMLCAECVEAQKGPTWRINIELPCDYCGKPSGLLYDVESPEEEVGYMDSTTMCDECRRVRRPDTVDDPPANAA